MEVLTLVQIAQPSGIGYKHNIVEYIGYKWMFIPPSMGKNMMFIQTKYDIG